LSTKEGWSNQYSRQSWQAKKVSQNIAIFRPIGVRHQKEVGAVGLQFLRHFYCGERRLCHAVEGLKANAAPNQLPN
jgi:hypothetical protein